MPKKKAMYPSRRGSNRRLSVRSVLRSEPDMDKLARSLAALAIAQAEKEAQENTDASKEASDED
jgi:hypothetical protein